jgi:signal transduction histidine kinase
MTMDQQQLLRLLEVGRSLVTELDPEAVLDRILEEAREATGARYVALGVLDDQRAELERFLTLGVDDATQRAIGERPRGRGVLGELIEHPQPLRLSDLSEHPHSYGFPPGHPAMGSFLGVPIVIRGQAWGNLYLAEKLAGGEFTDADEEATVVLSDFAATAIENARLYRRTEQRRQELERAVQGLEAARDIADAIGGIAELERILQLVVKRGRALVDARTVLIMLREGDELVVVAAAGHTNEAHGRRLPIANSTSGQVLEQQRPERVTDVAARLRVAPEELGVPGAHTALLVPMVHHGVGVGVLAAFDRGQDGETFTGTDEQLLRTFASSAANAVAISRSVEADRLRSTIAAAEAERGRWARELHDETLQALGALRIGLAASLKGADPEANVRAMQQAVEEIGSEIESLRAIISDLRPSLLDDLGLKPAIEALLERRRHSGLKVISELSLPDSRHGAGAIDPAVETTVYRFIQEALTNVVKHAHASTARVAATLDDGELVVEVKDNGTGFDRDQSTSGYGLAGMRERVFISGGTLELHTSDGGTVVRARIKLGAATAAEGQAASGS